MPYRLVDTDGLTDDEVASRLPELVKPDRIHSQMYHDERIFDLEMERIFNRDWVYLAHESEIPEPGAFVTRRLGKAPVVVTRGDGGEMNVLLNRCPHRGNVVCLRDSGNGSHFRCAYHGWTFRMDGGCSARTFPDAYDQSGPADDRNMVKIGRVESYRGLIFASGAYDGPTVLERLGAAKTNVDRFLDRAPAGTMTVSGVHKMRFRGNWKMPLENSVDDYHPAFVHRGVVEQDRHLKEAIATTDETAGVVRDLGGGIAELDFGPGRRVIGSFFTDPIPPDVQASYEAQLVERLGSEKANLVLNHSTPHMMIFPNLFMVQNDLRIIVPISARLTHYYHYFLELDGADPIINSTRRRRHEVSYGPAGSVLGDDLDVFERNQIGLESDIDGRGQWLDLSRGMAREHRDENGYLVSYTKDETGMRGIWRYYLEAMSSGVVAVPA